MMQECNTQGGIACQHFNLCMPFDVLSMLQEL
jgi:hypothetical protein